MHEDDPNSASKNLSSCVWLKAKIDNDDKLVLHWDFKVPGSMKTVLRDERSCQALGGNLS